MASNARLMIAALSLSAAGLVGITLQEGYTDKAIRPVPNDPPTYGFGSTTRQNGEPVQMTDAITPPKALVLALRDIEVNESVLKRCFTGQLTQGEYDAYVDLAYNVGPNAVCRSSIPAKVAVEHYRAACMTILDFKKVQGRDCSLPANQRFCGGVWTRRQKMTRLCLGEPE